MASVSASHLIIFVASIVIAAGVVGTLTTGVERVSSSIDDGSLDVSQQISMDMAIISDPSNPDINDGTLTIHVRNTGSQEVPREPSGIDVVLNGQFITEDDLTVRDANSEDEGGVWRPNEVIEIEIEVENSDELEGDNRLFLTVFGDEELFEFHYEN